MTAAPGDWVENEPAPEGGANLHPEERGSNRFFSWTTPKSYWDVIGAHLPLALVAWVVLIVSFFSPPEGVGFRTCTFLGVTGYPCPFCGFTRAFVGIANGRLLEALQSCPLSIPVYAAIALICAWNTDALLFGVRLERGPWLRLRKGKGFLVAAILVGAVIVNWLYRLGLGLK
jgi:hypothetical protein